MKTNLFLIPIVILLFTISSCKKVKYGTIGSDYPNPKTEISNLTYYVSPDGSDDNDGTFAPFKTIEYACTILNAGDSLIVKSGEYYPDGDIVVYNNGTAEYPITIVAERKGEVHINGTMPASDIWGDGDEYGNGFFLDRGVSNIIIDGFHIKHFTSGVMVDGSDTAKSENIIIKNCILEDNSDSGLLFWKAKNCHVQDCDFISTIPDGDLDPLYMDGDVVIENAVQDYGVAFYYSDNTSVTDCYFYGTLSQNISYKYGCKHGLIKRNIFEGSVSATMFIGQGGDGHKYCSHITVEQNIIRGAQGYELETPIRLNEVFYVNIFNNYLEGFASNTEGSGIHLEQNVEGTINIHDNIIVFGTMENYASGITPDYRIPKSTVVNISNNTFFNLVDDVTSVTKASINFTDNISFQCNEYFDVSATNNYNGDPSFINNTPVQLPVVTEFTKHNFDTYFNQLTEPYKLAPNSSAAGKGYRF